ncbi:MAG: membrane lipoprotein lipid attachment site-containing protein [Clostridia bacterium]|nr:membrane lipoprotein lipid attachment site-containing protein [Clostridia bacterium]
MKRFFVLALTMLLLTGCTNEIHDAKSIDLAEKNLPWTEPITAPFEVKVPPKSLPAIELLFTTENYEFYRSDMNSIEFVYTNGHSFTKAELQELIDAKTVTPEQVAASLPLWIVPKQVSPTDTGMERFGKMLSFYGDNTVSVVQKESRVQIYPPYDFVGEFYEDPMPKLGGDERSLGYYVNVTHLQRLATAAAVTITIPDDTQNLSVGDSQFVSKAAIEACGIELTVVRDEQLDQVTELVITLP